MTTDQSKGTDREFPHLYALKRRLAVGFFSAAVIVWLGSYFLVRFLWPDLNDQSKVGDAFGAGNALFSALALAALIYTVVQQQIELRLTAESLLKTAEANASVAIDQRANAVFDMYAAFRSEQSSRVRTGTWKIFQLCLTCKPYHDFLVGRYFVTEHSTTLPDECHAMVADLYPTVKGESELATAESRDRHYVLDLMNFYCALALREAPREAFLACDFFYDWWRPFLWWYCDAAMERYDKLPNELKRYIIRPNWGAALKRLDDIYGLGSGETREERNRSFFAHPVTQGVKVDERHNTLAHAVADSNTPA